MTVSPAESLRMLPVDTGNMVFRVELRLKNRNGKEQILKRHYVVLFMVSLLATSLTVLAYEVRCARCNGTGVVVQSSTCPSCGGTSQAQGCVAYQ